jgi:hypothetical protein
MFGFRPKLPILEEQREWVNSGFHRLEKLLGRSRMLNAKVVEPTAKDFPDHYNRTPEALESLFCRVCGYMQVDRRSIKLEIFPDEAEELRATLPSWRSDGRSHAAGLYLHALEKEEAAGKSEGMVVAIRSTMLKDPMSLVATVAHELGHVIMLGGKLIKHDTADHEPLTDLLTVFLGLGIFTANSAARFKQFQENRRIGWSMNSLGYLPERVFGYALAKFAVERDDEAAWSRHLTPNVKSDFNNSRRWLEKNPQYVSMPDSIQ